MSIASLLEKLKANDFTALSGLRISGSVPLQQDLIDEALDEIVQGWSNPNARRPAKEAPTPSEFVKLIKRIQVRAEAGAVTVEFEIRV
jgi:hypothetical protein